MGDILAVRHVLSCSINVSLFSNVYQAGRPTISDLHPCTTLMTRSRRQSYHVLSALSIQRHDAISCHPCYCFHLLLCSIPKDLFNPDTSTFIQKKKEIYMKYLTNVIPTLGI